MRPDQINFKVSQVGVALFVLCAATGLAGVPAILVRPPTSAISSMRILVGWDVAEYVWEEIFRAGQPWTISPLGVDALDLLNQPPK